MIKPKPADYIAADALVAHLRSGDRKGVENVIDTAFRTTRGVERLLVALGLAVLAE
tara:strand:- start:11503 stop:11670 length:168 start_codon:yes stop_codon:yes gene_type:complete